MRLHETAPRRWRKEKPSRCRIHAYTHTRTHTVSQHSAVAPALECKLRPIAAHTRNIGNTATKPTNQHPRERKSGQTHRKSSHKHAGETDERTTSATVVVIQRRKKQKSDGLPAPTHNGEQHHSFIHSFIQQGAWLVGRLAVGIFWNVEYRFNFHIVTCS